MSASPLSTRTASVLVVEDNMDAADSIARFLRLSSGYAVRVAYTGETGVKMALADPPDAIICDIALPKLDGFRVAQELADLLRVKPLMIAVTAFGGIYPEGRARAAGFDHYLTKPADPFAIESLIGDHIQRRKSDQD
ncbi:MAG TPA: response regulator [Gemmataceae bacterium]|nr:response regulator [Gemmataceae bacterium]